MKPSRLNISLYGLAFLAACTKQPPPVSVAEFMENPRLLEATMVRCGQNRAELKYEAECVNARDAVNRLEARENKARRDELEAMSERKRQALRRTQQAAAEARRRTVDAAQQGNQGEHPGVAGDQPVTGSATDIGTAPAAVMQGNAPGVEISPPEDANVEDPAPPDAGVGSDLNSIREELERRQSEPQ